MKKEAVCSVGSWEKDQGWGVEVTPFLCTPFSVFIKYMNYSYSFYCEILQKAQEEGHTQPPDRATGSGNASAVPGLGLFLLDKPRTQVLGVATCLEPLFQLLL